jgi:hypothetical protein
MEQNEFYVNYSARYNPTSVTSLTEGSWKQPKGTLTVKHKVVPEIYLGENNIWDVYVVSWQLIKTSAIYNRWIALKIEEVENSVHVNNVGTDTRWFQSHADIGKRLSFSNPSEKHSGYRLLPEYYPQENGFYYTPMYPVKISACQYPNNLYIGTIRNNIKTLRTLTFSLQNSHGDMPFQPSNFSSNKCNIMLDLFFKKRLEDPSADIKLKVPSKTFVMLDYFMNLHLQPSRISNAEPFTEVVKLTPGVEISGTTDVYLEYLLIGGVKISVERIMVIKFDEIIMNSATNINSGDNVVLEGTYGVADGGWVVPAISQRMIHLGRINRAASCQFYPKHMRLGRLRVDHGTLDTLNIRITNNDGVSPFMNSGISGQGAPGAEITIMLSLVTI